MIAASRMLAAVLLVATLGVAPAPAQAAAIGNSVNVHIDPSYRQPTFEGWGTSLVWMSNATGGYPDEIRKKLVDMVFGADGLNLNIARYNIGGGNAPGVRDDYMKVGATMPGFWKAPAGTTQADMEWWDPANPDHWNWDADANQRWWIDQIKDKVTHWEAFSNSPPWFQTVSGYVSGGFNPSTDQIRADRVDEFAEYMVRVTEEIERRHGISFATINPLNEPNTNYWGTTLGADGQPTGGRQEGAHAGPALQQQVLLALRERLNNADTGAVISAMDETNPGTFMTNWNAYTAESRAAVEQMNVHTYGTGQRTSVRDAAKAAGKKLWMSEVEGNWGPGTTDYTGMLPGLGIAGRIVDDIRELEPSAWVFWQPIEDSVPQQASGGNWGSIHVPFNCPADATPANCPIQVNSKYDTIRNFTHFIRPGDHFVKVSDTSSVAAVNARGVTVVHVNSGADSRSVTLDLSGFRSIRPGAKVTPVVSSASGGLVRGKPVKVAHKSAVLTVPGQSVTTFLVDGVSGVSGTPLLADHFYRLEGVASGRSLAPGIVLRDNADSADQLWSFTRLAGGTSNRARYAVVNAATGTRLAVRDGTLTLDPGTDAATEWILSTTGDGTWTLINVATGRLIDVAGQATADGSPVSTYTPTSGGNQRWTAVDETVLSTSKVVAYTVPKLVPTLPATVTPVYPDGARGSLPVVWSLPPASAWRKPGKVRVRGVATDVLGRKHTATALVTVDTFVATAPVAVTTYVGGQPVLPATVTGLGRHGGRAALPVTWAASGPFDQLGTVTVRGTATVVDGTRLAATARVRVVEPVEANAATEQGVTVSATYTEPGYATAGLRNGDRTEKAWSNWRSGTKNPADTITVALAAPKDLTRVVTYFYRDGSNVSTAETLRVQVQGPDGTWTDASAEIPVPADGAPVIDVPVDARATAARVVLTARPGGYMTVSEIEVYAKAVP
ncbi:RICIN domain-containing protein [Paractinoplanes rishiriensis]|uniref:F5/8 type C domain-containing protein n=1 Tax=Paractinoplanes rishiriensis TaxID=1050105 RepID=A0A919MZW0_9ACTN|nr:RICIN domain-containing protein [Actinoplanes rishiriensis]GIE94312.1 hypothetical protein Ari01nite_17770 [Actinoplanes rishiriensis]